ncbi:hypothetical protein OAO87_00505, partial [bacterium]|nr:hypothetical protein [bacterium]
MRVVAEADRFDAPTTVSTVRLTSDAPADYPRAWELQARADAHAPFVTILRVSRDAGITCPTRLRQFRCDLPRTRSYEVRSQLLGLLFRGASIAVSTLSTRASGSRPPALDDRSGFRIEFRPAMIAGARPGRLHRVPAARSRG